jgi:zinc protease
VTFDPQEVDRERGVILEEWRLGLGAEARIRDAQMPILLNGSRYAERLPIGQPDVLKKASVERLKQFYKDWYRPDLMAVIVVGDFDPAVVEKGSRRTLARFRRHSRRARVPITRCRIGRAPATPSPRTRKSPPRRLASSTGWRRAIR